MSHTSVLRPVALAILLLQPCRMHAQGAVPGHESPVPEVAAVRREAPVTLDGRLDDPDWARARPAGDFTEFEPNDGVPATQRTEVRFLFDDDAIYVGARMFDDQGAKGVKTQLVRRDTRFDSDYLNVVFDTYHDHLGGSFFSVNPSGVKQDELSGDDSWDPIWEVATQVDSLGWTAELRIPFSQLRFPRAADQTWGLELARQVTRLNEFSRWAPWHKNENGGPSRYGHLTGITAGKHLAQLELLPYAVAQSTNRAPGKAGDPFYRSNQQNGRIGVDLKYLLTSNLTLSATVNPDFGQVEVDPASVNLSAFETFFQERRPFFVEGSDYFGFGSFWCYFCSNASSLSLFYSRRIGRVPQGGSYAQSQSEYAQVPDNTTILGAAKVTGKTRSGWSLAMLDAVGSRESAQLLLEDGSRTEMQVEPSTNYLVSRVRRDMRGGNLVVGGIATSTFRARGTQALEDRLPHHAESLGLDSELWWKKRTYHLLASAAIAGVAGDSSAIRRIEESSARYFQRPDRHQGSNGFFSDAYDPNLTALRGYGVYSRIAKDGGNWTWELAGNARSPGFEVNDISFLQRTDYLWFNSNLQRHFTTPTKYYRRLNVLAGAQRQLNYDGDVTDRQSRVSVFTELPNYWDLGGFVIDRGRYMEDRLTRGGPAVMREGNVYYQLNLSTDSRRALTLNTNPSISRHPAGTDYSVNVGARVRPASNVTVSVGPSYDDSRTAYQYVTTKDDPTATAFLGHRYVFADLHQRTLSMDTRLNVTFTPRVSFELYAQPYLSSGDYTRFKEYQAPRQLALNVYGVDVGTITTTATGDKNQYRVDPDGSGPAAAFTFDDPNFNFRSLRGNAVFRWEYRPGSTLFLVWAQNRSDTGTLGNLSFERDRRALFSAPANNVFLVKVNYWLSR